MCRENFFAAFRLSFWLSAGRTSGLILLIVPFVAGCGRPSGPQRAAVRGKVSLDQAPLKAGVIRFTPKKGPVALTRIEDGRYELNSADGPVLGTNSIEIVPGVTDNPLAGATDIKTAWAEYARSAASRAPEIVVLKKYKRNSPLKVDVTAKGNNTFDFKLASQ